MHRTSLENLEERHHSGDLGVECWILVYFRTQVGGHKLDSCGMAKGQEAGFCQYGSMQCEKCRDSVWGLLAS